MHDDRRSAETISVDRRRRALFVIQETAHFHELVKLAQALTQTGRYRASFVAYTTYDHIARDEARCDALGMQMHHGFYLKPLRQCVKDRLHRLAIRISAPVTFGRAARAELHARTGPRCAAWMTLLLLVPLYVGWTLGRAVWRACKPWLPAPLRRCGEVLRSGLWTLRRRASLRLREWPRAVRRAGRRLLSDSYTFVRHPKVRVKRGLRALARRTLPRFVRHRLRLVQRYVDSSRFTTDDFFKRLWKRIVGRVRPAWHVLLRLTFRLAAIVEPRLRAPNLPGVLLHYVRRRRHFRSLLDNLDVDVVVLAEDNVGHATGIFTQTAARRGIPTVTVPYTIANAREFAESYFDVPEHQQTVFANRVLRRLRPKWVHEHRGRVLTRLPTWYCVAQDLLGIAPRRPWAFNSGSSAAIVVESRRTVDYYRRAGLDREPLLPLGSMFDDELAVHLAQSAERRTRLYEALRLPPDRPLLLTAVPPNQLISRPNCGFADFDALVRGWLAPLAEQTKFNVVVRLHPRTDRKSLRWIETELGLRVSEESTAHLVPSCDLYVASVSATIRWALACGKPVVNFDVYGYRYDDYDDAPGVAAVDAPAAYADLIRRCAEDAAWFDELARRQQADAPRWGVLDGGATARIVGLFDQLTIPEAEALREDGHHRHGTHGATPSAGRPRQAA